MITQKELGVFEVVRAAGIFDFRLAAETARGDHPNAAVRAGAAGWIAANQGREGMVLSKVLRTCRLWTPKGT
jgi:hypothetical protein